MRIIIIGIILLTGCEEQTDWTCDVDVPEPAKQLWIDTRCSERVAELVEDATDEMNRFGRRHMCRNLVEVVGYTDDDSLPSIQCRPGHSDEGIAHANENTVSVYPDAFDGADDEWVRSIILHELTHWIGVGGHTKEKDACMYHQARGIDHYTPADRELICEWLDCIN
jgi:hypothetical protein